jgi:putative MFS transporter
MSQVLAGKMFDLHGVSGMFGMIAAMYFIFAIAVQFAPETFGRSIEEGAGGESPAGQESAVAAGVHAGSQERTA